MSARKAPAGTPASIETRAMSEIHGVVEIVNECVGSCAWATVVPPGIKPGAIDETSNVPPSNRRPRKLFRLITHPLHWDYAGTL